MFIQMQKWLWRFNEEDNALWIKGISVKKNGLLSHWISKASPSPAGISISKNIGLWDFFVEHISLQVGKRRKI